MAEAYDVLAGLNRMLESQERREQTKLQTSLAMMQFAQSKRMQDVQLAGQQLQMLQTSNTQMMATQSQDFLTSTGFSYFYRPDDTEWAEEFKDALIDKGADGYGFSETDAFRIVGAVASAYAGNPSPILDIAGELYDYTQVGENELLSTNANLFLEGFKKIGMFPGDDDVRLQKSLNQLSGIKQTLQNRDDIIAEMYEFGRGDFVIDRDIKLAEREKLPSPEFIPTGTAVEEEDDDFLGLPWIDFSSKVQGHLSNDIQKLIDEIDTDKSKVKGVNKKISELAVKIERAKIRQKGNLDLSPLEESLIKDEGDAISQYADELNELSESIDKKTKEARALTILNKEQGIRSGAVDMPASILHFGIDPLQKFWLWNKTGIWPDDDLLKAAEAAHKYKLTLSPSEYRKYKSGLAMDSSK